VSVDLRGFGESDAPEHGYAIEGFTDDVMFMADQLGLEQPIVIGHSLGGMVALDLAARYPSRLAAAVILQSMVAARNDVASGLLEMLPRVAAEDYRDFVCSLMARLAGPNFEAGERTRLAQSAASCRQHVLVASLRELIEFDSVAAASAVKCPLLYVGTETEYADLGRFRQLCPQLVTGQLVGCGHYFPIEVPDQLASMLRRFIETSVPGPG
jgi:pimeloyl-ACP methyl ester carboxylesterase